MQSERVIMQLDDTLKHKQYVLETCNKMAKYLFEQDRDDLAFELLRRAIVHDNSKLRSDELNSLTKIKKTNEALTNANYILDDSDKRCIELHWKHNRHHPEYFSSPEEMTEADIIEMVCDWYSRSLQFGTDFLDFVYTRQNNRFHFPEEMFNKIINYCNIVMSL